MSYSKVSGRLDKLSFKSNKRWSKKAESEDSIEWLEEPVRFGVDSFVKSNERKLVERQLEHNNETHVSHKWTPVFDDKLKEEKPDVSLDRFSFE
jgi:hypothetical protein